jgi:hypothetical protein
MASYSVLGIFLPAISGVVISRSGFDILFIAGIFLMLASSIPYWFIPRTDEQFCWGVKETWKNFFAKKNRRVISAFICDGADEAFELIVWPVFVFVLFLGDYFSVGVLFSLILAASVFLQLFIGRYIDLKASKESILKYGSFLFSLGWIFKIFVATPFQVFIADIYHRITKIFLRTPFDALSYELASSKGHDIDEFVVLREISIQLGKTLALAAVAVFSLFFGLKYAFILAVFSSLGFILMGKREEAAR